MSEILLYCDDREASMDQQQPYCSQSDLADVQTAESGRTAALKFRTFAPGNPAHIEQDSTGRAYLHFRGLRYGVDNHVAHSLVRSLSISPSGTIGEFVYRRMITLHEYRDDEWPDLARQFLLQHTTGQSAGRSRLTWWRTPTHHPNQHYHRQAPRSIVARIRPTDLFCSKKARCHAKLVRMPRGTQK
jgi:hypothetical protein